MSVRHVDAATLKHWLDASEAVLVDVREPAEHAAENIAGAVLLPLGGVHVAALPQAGGKKLVLHCGSGKRSMAACEKLLAENAQLELYNLQGGISAWGAAGQDVKRSGQFFLPLDRQVQLTIGVLLVLISGLGALFSPMWFLFTGLMGAGLMLAGLTGFCGLALVMARMPWNQKNGSVASCCVK